MNQKVPRSNPIGGSAGCGDLTMLRGSFVGFETAKQRPYDFSLMPFMALYEYSMTSRLQNYSQESLPLTIKSPGTSDTHLINLNA